MAQRLYREIEQAEVEGKADRVAALEAELALPEFPDVLDYLWRGYLRLRRRAPLGLAGAQPVGWPELLAFAELTGDCLTPWEVEVIERIDDAFLYPAEQKGEAQGRPMTEQLFDTIFK